MQRRGPREQLQQCGRISIAVQRTLLHEPTKRPQYGLWQDARRDIQLLRMLLAMSTRLM